MKSDKTRGHLAAFFTTLFWGTTFISTKVLLTSFHPIEILFLRFFMGLIALTIGYPHWLKIQNKKQELIFLLAGLCGVTLYFLLENIALTYTLASNVGVIISISPFFTGILSKIVFRTKEKLGFNFFIGFLCALIGIGLISFQGNSIQLNPFGDFLAVLAAFVWALYSVLTRIIAEYGYHTIQTTQRTFFYGIILMIPALLFFGFQPKLSDILQPVNAANLIFLGLGASASCFVTWNFAVRTLGAIKTSVYIYAVPVVTVITSVLVLHEKITVTMILGTAITLIGLALSEGKLPFINKNI